MRKSKLVTPAVFTDRDLYFTPRYATELLVPFIPKEIKNIWECAAGELAISNVLVEKGYTVYSSDIRENKDVSYYDFLSPGIWNIENTAIITNPPFSLKTKFFSMCIEYDLPFALLINADYSLWSIEAITKFGCEKIIPTRRIQFTSPDQPKNMQGSFHSMWLTRGFNLGKSETFVELSREDKKNV